MSGVERLRIAQLAPPAERVPPYAYGGTERVVHALVAELVRRGHEVTTFASADSEIPGRHHRTVPKALRPAGYAGDQGPYFIGTALEASRRADEFDIVHSHLEWISLLLARAIKVPLVATFHGRLDLPWIGPLFADPPRGLVAISRSQASVHPEVPWEAIVHNGLDLSSAPFERRRGDDLCFVGRVSREKGILDAIEIARLSGRRLRIAAKIGRVEPDRSFWADVVKPALERADVEFLGEVNEADRNALFASSYASLMPGAWPEPFGLVAIESLACGTPLLARRAGALPEIVRDGVDGFLGDDAMHLAYLVDRVASLDRAAIRASVLERFSAAAMADRYEAVYAAMLGLPLEPGLPVEGAEAAGRRQVLDADGLERRPVLERGPLLERGPVLARRPRRPDLARGLPYRHSMGPMLAPRGRPRMADGAERPDESVRGVAIPVGPEAPDDDRVDGAGERVAPEAASDLVRTGVVPAREPGGQAD